MNFFKYFSTLPIWSKHAQILPIHIIYLTKAVQQERRIFGVYFIPSEPKLTVEQKLTEKSKIVVVISNI